MRKYVNSIAPDDYNENLRKNFYSEYTVIAFDSGSFKEQEYFIGIAYITYKKNISHLNMFRGKGEKTGWNCENSF